MKTKFYTAGKIWHAPKFRQLRDVEMLPVNARWIDAENDSDLVMNRKGDLWQMCIEDVRDSDFLLLYSEHFDEEHRGALAEIGIAQALGKPIYAIGKSKSISPNAISDVAFTHHRLFHWLDTTCLNFGVFLALSKYAFDYRPTAKIALATGKV